MPTHPDNQALRSTSPLNQPVRCDHCGAISTYGETYAAAWDFRYDRNLELDEVICSNCVTDAIRLRKAEARKKRAKG